MAFSIIPSLIQLAHHAAKTTFLNPKHPHCKITLQIIGIILSGLTAISCTTAGLIMGSWAITAPGIALIICLMTLLIVSHFHNHKKVPPPLTTSSNAFEMIFSKKSLLPTSANSSSTETHHTEITTLDPLPSPTHLELSSPHIDIDYRVFANPEMAQLQTKLRDEWGMELLENTFLTIRNLKNRIRLTLAPITHLDTPFDTSSVDNVKPNSTFEEGFLHLINRWKPLPKSPFRLASEPQPDKPSPFTPSPILNREEYLLMVKERFFLTFLKIEENNFSHVQMPFINRNCFICYNDNLHSEWLSSCYNSFLDTIASLSAESSVKHVILVDPHQPLKVIDLAANFCYKINSNKNKSITKTTYLILK
ncbi:hypothetical protein CLAVI_000202 [Candidatus Clavichlamydia salmonicola]|uniref:hypothetical protein n=1 Tax=Candidatus Clavichlamydia salmonicola TaxID=469812 RepID=UPI001891149E|nr:hypothetical protein [Candidatus Clavichlamydia salmonicola]MBF5050591.1 hypothetical protein [Candidatus Clavichlamydia salmonicola]